jgi:hypothetical protein
MKYQYNDGGRSASGRKGFVGDCVARSIAIVAELPYQEVYDAIANGVATERKTKYRGASGKKTASSGVHVKRKWFKDYMEKLGFRFTPTMGIGTGCRVHMRDGELPMGRLIVSLSGHYTAVVEGVCHDNHNPCRGGNRCVYGYWSKKVF